MKKEAVKRTAEEKAQLIDQVDQVKASENLTVEQACKKVGVNWFNYYNWKRKKKTTTKRRKKRPTLINAIVPTDDQQQNQYQGSPSNGSSGSPDAFQIAEMLAVMNARSLQALMRERK